MNRFHALFRGFQKINFTAKLIDVHPPNEDHPNGFAMNLTEGILRGRYRDSWERLTPMVPGEVYAITIERWSVRASLTTGSLSTQPALSHIVLPIIPPSV